MHIHVCIHYIYLREIIIVSPVQRYLCNRLFPHFRALHLESSGTQLSRYENINGAILFKENC